MNTPRAPRPAGQARTMPPHKYFGSQRPCQAQRGISAPSFEPQAFQGNAPPFPPQMGGINPPFPAPVHLMNHNPNAHVTDNGQVLMNLLNMLAQQRHQSGLVNGNFSSHGLNPQMGFHQNVANSLSLTNQVNPFQGQLLSPAYAGFGHPQTNHALAISSMNNQMQNAGSGLPSHLLDASRAGLLSGSTSSNQYLNPSLLNLVQNLLFTGQVNQDPNHCGIANFTPMNPAGPQFFPNHPEERSAPLPQLFNNHQAIPSAQPVNNIGDSNQGGTRNFKSQRFAGNDGQREWKERPRFGHQKTQFRQKDNRKRNFEVYDKSNNKGYKLNRPGFESCNNDAPERKRKIFVPSYTEQEIRKWREDRKKNYPSRSNLENKSKIIHSDALESEAQLRREQLKEILSKQAELGVEVAEIPSQYLGDSDIATNRNERNRKPFNKRRNGKFKNNRDTRGSHHERFVRKKNPANMECNREPTLLQKLLNADIQKEKRQLLQIFRFMVSNSFFKDWPQTPLKYPVVQVDESLCDVSRGKPPTEVSTSNLVHLDRSKDHSAVSDCHGLTTSTVKDRGGSIVNDVPFQKIEDAEEGEIID